MLRSLLLLFLTALLLEAVDKPSTPYYDWDVCPGEGCVYRSWTARKATPVYAGSWNIHGNHRIAEIKAGEKVLALTGVVVTLKPGVIRIDRDLPAKQLKSGDTVLTYAYRGEGNSAVWFNGSYRPDYDIAFATWPDGSGCQHQCGATVIDEGEHVWWAQVKLSSGLLGWVDMDNSQFDGTCAFSHQQ